MNTISVYNIDNVNKLHDYLISRMPKFHITTTDESGIKWTSEESSIVEQNPETGIITIHLGGNVDKETVELHIQQYKVSEGR